jgi:hypothetical protein
LEVAAKVVVDLKDASGSFREVAKAAAMEVVEVVAAEAQVVASAHACACVRLQQLRCEREALGPAPAVAATRPLPDLV